jgi:hypothetical protein
MTTTSRPTAATVRTGALAVGVLITGLVLRWLLIRSVFGSLNSDEAYSGLQSIGVLRDGRLPVVIDGNVYSATIEAYLFSPVLSFAGGSAAVLKWLFIGMWAAAAATTFGATRQLLNRRAAAAAGALVWLAPGALLVLSTRAYMCYALGLAVVAGTVWATTVVADQQTPTPRASAVAGFLAGLAFYVHPMLVAVVGPVIAVAALVHRRDWRRWWLPSVAGAILANLAFLAWNAVNGWPSLTGPGYQIEGAQDRFRGFIARLLPRALGLRTFDGRWVLGRPFGLLLYAAIAVAVVVGCIELLRNGRPSRWIVPVGLICCLPLMALLPNLAYVDDGRYGIIPFPLIAIALGAATSRALRNWSMRRAVAILGATLALWVGVTSVAFLHRQHGLESARPNAWQERTIARLHELGIDRVAGNYWLVLPLEYRSDRSIRTAVAGPYPVRFPESQRLVQSAPPEEVAFVFTPGELDPSLFYLPIDSYRREDLGDIILYVPLALGT